ncbi:MAG: hypothetical protein CR994_09035 [Maribacter sp.]|nr:MAG: hypothetical protein CR994_09035 [Maribacter sp.]
MIRQTKTDLNNYLIKQLPNATVFLNKKLEVVYVSDKFADDFEFTSSAIIGKRIEVLFPSIGKECLNKLRTNLKGLVNKTQFVYFTNKDNQYKRHEWTNTPWYDENENIIGVIIQTEDITKKALDKLKLEKLESILSGKSEIAKIGTWEYNIEENSLHWCDITKKIHEVPLDFIPNIDKTIDFYKNGFSKNTIAMALNNALKNKTPWNEKLKIITAKGREKWVITSGKPIFHNDKMIGLLGTLQDINDDVLSQRKIEESENLLKTLIDNLPMSVYIKDIESRKILVNKAECDFAGVSDPSMILGKDDFQIYDKKTAQGFREEDLEVIKTLKPILGKETVCKAKNRPPASILVYKIPSLVGI